MRYVAAFSVARYVICRLLQYCCNACLKVVSCAGLENPDLGICGYCNAAKTLAYVIRLLSYLLLVHRAGDNRMEVTEPSKHTQSVDQRRERAIQMDKKQQR